MSRALSNAGFDEVLVHTGQHYDYAMSEVFFAALKIQAPKYVLGVGSASHGAQTGKMLDRLEPIMITEAPDVVLTYGDTNSTLAGALAAAKLHIHVAHVEAGLRSFNRRMPEEINRVMADHLSSILFAPTDAAVSNLHREGIVEGVYRTGDVMYDAVLAFRHEIAERADDVIDRFALQRRQFALVTIHRAENTDDQERWMALLDGISRVSRDLCPVVWPIHPRVRAKVNGIRSDRLILLDPQPYFEMQALLMNARVVMTDSGGVQKEAAFHGVPCVTLRDETEWVELTDAGVNRLAGADPDRIVRLATDATWPAGASVTRLYGDGRTSDVIAHRLAEFITTGADNTHTRSLTRDHG